MLFNKFQCNVTTRMDSTWRSHTNCHVHENWLTRLGE